MSSDLLLDRAALYVAGALTAEERENFELVLEFEPGVRANVARLEAVGTALASSRYPQELPPARGLKSRLFDSIATRPQIAPESLVVTGLDGRIQWTNAAFSRMCGHSAEELRGQKPGALLQGPRTDPQAVQRIREAVRANRACCETLLNYHKDGSVYRVEISIAPLVDDDGNTRWFAARERQLTIE